MNSQMTQKQGYVLSLLVFLGALAGYLLISRDIVHKPSIAPYFINLAQAFIDGNPYISMDATNQYDLIYYGNLWYVAQPPLPGIMLMPWLWLFGTVSDVLFSVFVGAINVMLCERVLRVGVPQLGLWARLALTAFFGFGTAHLYLTSMGTVWFLGQTCAVLVTWLFLSFSLHNRPFLAGTALGLALMARPNIAFGALAFVAVLWAIEKREEGWLRRVILFCVPLAFACLFLGAYNLIRFDSVTDFGYSYLNDSETIRERRLTYGNFSPAFLPENLYIATIKTPAQVNLNCLIDPQCATVIPDLWGTGFLWTNPLFLVGLLALRSRLFWAVAVGTVLILLPSLMYHNTGSAQFGYRFLLDALPLWMLAIGMGVTRIAQKRWYKPVLGIGVSYSLLVNIVGGMWFMSQLIPPPR